MKEIDAAKALEKMRSEDPDTYKEIRNLIIYSYKMRELKKTQGGI